MVEEAMKAPPCKSKKTTKGKYKDKLSRTKAHERIFLSITYKSRKIETSVGLLVKIPTTPKKN
jgi:hypothetical protein